jgi:hypothetical protein
VPVVRTAYESVERLRTWASGRRLSADQPGIYNPNTSAVTVKPGRYPFTGANRHTYMDGAAHGGSVDSARERGAGYGGKVMAR